MIVQSTTNGDELIAAEGYKLTDGNGYYSRVFLGCNDSADRYTEIAIADIPAETEESPDETIPAWDIVQGQQIAVGDKVVVGGVVYECIQAHTASWSRQPPNEEYWEVITI